MMNNLLYAATCEKRRQVHVCAGACIQCLWEITPVGRENEWQRPGWGDFSLCNLVLSGWISTHYIFQ